MERWKFTAEHAGAAHRWFVEFGNFVAFGWGLLAAHKGVRRRSGPDLRFLVLLVTACTYMFLAGNRFSIFLTFTAFFALPMAALLVNQGSDYERAFARFGQLVSRRIFILVVTVIGLLGVFVSVALMNSYWRIRSQQDESPPLARLIERVFVQPSELAWVTFERVFLAGDWRPIHAFNHLFMVPIDPTRNTTPQFLMLEIIGEPRTSSHILNGFQFAGGFPEIIFELFGSLASWPVLLLIGLITAGLAALVVRAVYEGHLATAFFGFYVLFGVFVLFVGGMLNFLLPWTYWLKMTALLSALVIERALDGKGVRLVPWRLIEKKSIPQWVRRLLLVP